MVGDRKFTQMLMVICIGAINYILGLNIQSLKHYNKIKNQKSGSLFFLFYISYVLLFKLSVQTVYLVIQIGLDVLHLLDMSRASQHLEYDVASSLLTVLSDCELSCPDYLVVNLVRLLNQHLCIGN